MMLQMFEIRDCAVATSADYFRARRGSLVDLRAPPQRALRRFARSITVVAPTCALADALTKIVALQPAESAAILARHGAHAFLLGEAMGGTHGATTCAASNANLRLPLAAAA